MGKLVFAWQKGIISNCHKDAEDMWSQICCLIIFPPDMIRISRAGGFIFIIAKQPSFPFSLIGTCAIDPDSRLQSSLLLHSILISICHHDETWSRSLGHTLWQWCHAGANNTYSVSLSHFSSRRNFVPTAPPSSSPSSFSSSHFHCSRFLPP